MKKNIYIAGVISFSLIHCVELSAQNIAVNTSGTAAGASNMFEVTQTSSAAAMLAIYAITSGNGNGSIGIQANHSGAIGAGNTGYAFQAVKTGAGAGTNVAGYFSASAATGANYAIIVPSTGGNTGLGTSTPNTRLDVGIGNDNLAFYQPLDNTLALQAYLDGNWSNRTTYAGGCCNKLVLQPDVGQVGIGTSSPVAKLDIIADPSATYPQLRVRPIALAGSAVSIPSYLDFWSSFDAFAADQGPRRTASIKGMFSGGVWGNEALVFEVGGATDAALEPTERLRITGTGALAVNGATNYGAVNQVLTSTGNGPPQWAAIPGGGGGGGSCFNTYTVCLASTYTTTTAYTFTVPALITVIKIQVWGGGAGGGPGPGSSGAGSSGGGGGGGYAEGTFAVTAGNTYAVSVGAAGAGVQGGSHPSSTAAASSVTGTGVSISATGGEMGSTGSASKGGVGGRGGIGSGGSFNSTLGHGGSGGIVGFSSNGGGGGGTAGSGDNSSGSLSGGGGGGGLGGGNGVTYGASVGGTSVSNASPNTGAGGGGAAGGTSSYAGDGAAGKVIIYW